MIFINTAEIVLSPVFNWPIIGEIGYFFGYLTKVLYDFLKINNIFFIILSLLILLNILMMPLTYAQRKKLRLSFCVNKEKELIDEKYTYTDTESSKIREKADKKIINLKYGVNKSGIVFAIIQIFILIGIYSAILNVKYFIPNIDENFFNVFGINFSQICGYRFTPLIFVPIIVFLFQYLENIFSNIGYKDIKKIKIFNGPTLVSSLIIGMFAISTPLFISIYWVLSGILRFIIATLLDKLYFIKHDNAYFIDKEIKKINKKRAKKKLPKIEKETLTIKKFEGDK